MYVYGHIVSPTLIKCNKLNVLSCTSFYTSYSSKHNALILITCDPYSFVTVLFSIQTIIAYYLGVLEAHTASYNGELLSNSSVCTSCLSSCNISVLAVG